MPHAQEPTQHEAQPPNQSEVIHIERLHQ